MPACAAAVPATGSPRVLRWLRAAGDVTPRVLHRGPHAIHLRLDLPQGPRCLGVVDRAVPWLPHAIRLEGPGLASSGDRSVRLSDGVLHLGGTPVAVGTRPWTGPQATGGGCHHAPRPLAGLPSFARIDAAAVLALLGRGPGLTPLGDDVLVGWLAGRAATARPSGRHDSTVGGASLDGVGEALAQCWTRTTLLSATLLHLAGRGEVVPELAAFLAAAGTAGEETAVRRLRAVGASSGEGMLYGARLALHQRHGVEECAA